LIDGDDGTPRAGFYIYEVLTFLTQQHMWLQLLFIVLGFGLLIKGADWMVSGASALAKKYHVSDLIVGLTVVAFGTSAPELVVNAIASVDGHSDIVFGNVIGSNSFNLFVILGIVGLISPIVVQSSTIWKEIPISLLAIIAMYLLANNFIYGGDIPMMSRMDGIVLGLCFGAFLWYIFRQLKNNPDEVDLGLQIFSSKKIALLIVGGLIGLVLGGKLVVDNAIEVAASLGVSQKVIGLTIVAAGTSLPELVTSLVAAFKKNSDIAIGNVVGSNIFNIFLILALSAIIRPVGFNVAFNMEIYLLLAGSVFLFIAMFIGKKKKLDRWEAGLLLLVFVAYTGWMIQRG